jgi:hypothetical protein
MALSEEELKAQESAKEKGEKGEESGDKDKFASKEDLVAINARLEEQGRKSDEVFKLLTSEEFMKRSASPPAPPPKPTEKTLTTDEINDMNMSQGLGYMLKEVGKMIDKSNATQKESIDNIAASIKQVTDNVADKEADFQIASVKEEIGEDEFEKQRKAMVKIVAESPGITARRAYLVAIGEEKPPEKKEVRKGTETEKSGQEAEFTETDLKPEEAAEKAYDKAFGANKNPI